MNNAGQLHTVLPFLPFTFALLKRGKQKLLILQIRNGIKIVKNGIELISSNQLCNAHPYNYLNATFQM